MPIKYEDENEFIEFQLIMEGVKYMGHSPGLWGKLKHSGAWAPIVYFHRPRWMNKTDFNEMIKGMDIGLPFDVKVRQIKK